MKSSKVEISISPLKKDEYLDLINASESSTEFCNNPVDEIWNYEYTNCRHWLDKKK